MPEPEITLPGGITEDMAAEEGNLNVAYTSMANEFGASAARRSARFDQIAQDAASMWAIAMTTPTQNAALALRTATESGSGRTRAETNQPDQTGAGAPRTG